MEPQDRLQESLDALLSSLPPARRRWSLPEGQREELEPLLDVADDLALSWEDAPRARLRRRPGGALARPRGISSAVETCAEPDDVEDAPTLPSISALGSPANLPGHRVRGLRMRSRRVSWRVWTSLAAAILLALTITTFTVAANASPGSALYGVRRWQEDARTNLTNSDAERAKLHLQYATDALDALDAAVAQHASANIYSEALGRFTDELRQAHDALALVPAGTDHDSSQREPRRFARARAE